MLRITPLTSPLRSTPTPEASCTENFTIKLDENLYYLDGAYINSIVLVDFDNIVFKEFQFPKYNTESSESEINAPVVTWNCTRLH